MGSALSWTPRRRGEVYCAPACGRGCTWAEYQAARRKAQKLRTMGASLIENATHRTVRPVVHENLGWHAYAEYQQPDGGLTLAFYQDRFPVERSTSYSVWIKGGGAIFGHSSGIAHSTTWIGKGPTLMKALRDAYMKFAFDWDQMEAVRRVLVERIRWPKR